VPPVVTVVEPVLAEAGTDDEVDPRLKVQAAVCVTVTVLPATLRVPVRLDGAVLAAMENAVVPFPEPDEPLVIVSHAALELAVHAQPLPAVIETDEVPAVAAAGTIVGDTDGLQELAWVTVSVRPAIVIVPVRADAPVFAATE
jgi:hypothetical protein